MSRLNSFFPHPAYEAPTETPTATPAVGEPWYKGNPSISSEILGHWTNRGWHDKDAQTIAIEATKAHREAEKFIGAPADQLLRLPANRTDEAGWNAVWERLGAGKNSEAYNFSMVKSQHGEVDKALLDTMKNTAAAVKLPTEMAGRVVQEVVRYLDNKEAAKRSDEAFTLGEERATLQRNWGQNYEAHKLVAQNAARALGVDPSAVAALEKTLGYAKTMEMFRNVGTKIGEDKFVRSDNANSGGVMTVDQAVAKRSDLMADRGWVKRYMDGGSSEVREMTSLNTIITGSSRR